MARQQCSQSVALATDADVSPRRKKPQRWISPPKGVIPLRPQAAARRRTEHTCTNGRGGRREERRGAERRAPKVSQDARTPWNSPFLKAARKAGLASGGDEAAFEFLLYPDLSRDCGRFLH